MRKEHREILSRLGKIGRPALISEFRNGFPVNDRTLRRWLLMLHDEGRVEAIGTNKGRRYRLAGERETEPRIEDATLDALQQALLREVIRDAACGRTLTALLTERARTFLPAPDRRGFVGNTLRRLQAMTVEDAGSLGISPVVFEYWRRSQSSAESPDH